MVIFSFESPHVFQLWHPRLRMVSVSVEGSSGSSTRHLVKAFAFSGTSLRTIMKKHFSFFVRFWSCRNPFRMTLSNVCNLPNKCWIFFRATLQWSSPQTKHISIWTIMFISKTADIRQRETLEHCNRNVCIVKVSVVCFVKSWDNELFA